jgi:nitroreductase
MHVPDTSWRNSLNKPHKKAESMVYEKIASRRTIRKYRQVDVPEEILLRCVDAARLSPSGANRQPLKYVIVDNKELLREVFSTLSWAGYLPDYQPRDEEMPRAYIVILLDSNIRKSPGHDAGIAAMSISMVAYDEGLGSCILGAVDRAQLGKILNVSDDLEIVLVVALGYKILARQKRSITCAQERSGRHSQMEQRLTRGQEQSQLVSVFFS